MAVLFVSVFVVKMNISFQPHANASPSNLKCFTIKNTKAYPSTFVCVYMKQRRVTATRVSRRRLICPHVGILEFEAISFVTYTYTRSRRLRPISTCYMH